MVAVKSTEAIRNSFIKWNGWGPPTSEYQIGEYCRAETLTEEDSNYEFKILMEWMNDRATR